MALTIFENLPSTNTPITAENLNNNFSYSTPIGGIQAYAGNIAPSGYLLCDGQEVSRITYAELYALIGTTYGAGDGSTTFNVPNLKGKVIVGYDSTQTEFDTLGEDGGEKKHTLTIDELPPHNHAYGYSIKTFYGTGETGVQVVPNVYSSGGNAENYVSETSGTHGNVSASSQPHNILQPYMVLNYIIKY